jgi:hypothetical protein
MPSTSLPVVETINLAPAPDFSLVATGQTSETVAPGSTATFTFSVQQLPSQGVALTSPVLLGVAGLPAGTTANLSPAYVPLGSAATAVVLSFQTPLTAALPRSHTGVYGVALLPLLLLIRRRQRHRVACLALCVLAGATGCGTREYKATATVSSRSYAIEVTGSATGLSGAALVHSASVNLIVQ